jgi:hypothetical protein
MLLFLQVKELEQSLQASEELLRQNRDVMAAQEAQIQELVSASCAPGPGLSLCAFADAPHALPASATVPSLDLSTVIILDVRRRTEQVEGMRTCWRVQVTWRPGLTGSSHLSCGLWSCTILGHLEAAPQGGQTSA